MRVINTETVKADLEPETDEEGTVIQRYRKGEMMVIIEHLACGHVNNLGLKDAKSGECPKGCIEVTEE